MRDGREDAAQLDTIIDSLLRDGGRSRSDAEGELAGIARQLYDALPRFRPSFGFEDHLARRLAAGTRPAEDFGPPIPLPRRRPRTVEVSQAVRSAAGDRRRRGLVAGGAIASGVSLAIPIAGAALVMWRRSRSSGGLL